MTEFKKSEEAPACRALETEAAPMPVLRLHGLRRLRHTDPRQGGTPQEEGLQV